MKDLQLLSDLQGLRASQKAILGDVERGKWMAKAAALVEQVSGPDAEEIRRRAQVLALSPSSYIQRPAWDQALQIVEDIIAKLEAGGGIGAREQSAATARIGRSHENGSTVAGTGATLSVFVSHSNQDVELVKRIITLLRSALNIPASQIRATSVDGYRLPAGTNTDQQLRIEVQAAKVLIGIISVSSLRSAYVAFELGARWGSGGLMIPILAPDVGPDALAGPLRAINALSCGVSAQLHQFVEEMAGHLSLQLDSAAAYQKCIDDVLELRSVYEKEPSSYISGHIESPVDHALTLSVTARELLIGASRDPFGSVVKTETSSGMHLKANNSDLFSEHDPRTEALWEAALDELVDRALLKDKNGQGKIFKVTARGHEMVEMLERRPNLRPEAGG